MFKVILGLVSAFHLQPPFDFWALILINAVLVIALYFCAFYALGRLCPKLSKESRTWRITGVLGLLLLLYVFCDFESYSPSSSSAGWFEDGLAALHNSDYHAALVIFQPFADRGNAKAQFWVGVLYQDGQMGTHGQWTMKRDYAEAVKWYRKAADQGYPEAQESLSGMYLRGEGITKDLVEAYFWSMLAGAAGNKDGAESSASIATDLTREQRDAVKKRLSEWKPASVSPAKVKN